MGHWPMDQDYEAMKLQKQPNGWSCLPAAFAICLNIDIKDIFTWLGHDGSEVIWPSRFSPHNRRSFHPQELIDYCYWRHDKFVLQIDKEVISSNKFDDEYDLHEGYSIYRIARYLKMKHCFVLTGCFKDERWHAVAMEDGTVYDPGINDTCQLNSFIDVFNICNIFIL